MTDRVSVARAPARIASYQENRFRPIMAAGWVAVTNTTTSSTPNPNENGQISGFFLKAPNTTLKQRIMATIFAAKA